MSNGYRAGLPARVSRKGQAPEFRLRDGAVVPGEIALVDLLAESAGSLTKSTENEERDLGSQTAASGIFCTALKVSETPTVPVTPIVALETTGQNQVGRFEVPSSSSEPVEVEVLVEVSASATVGARLGVALSGTYGVLSATAVGYHAVLLEAATTNDGKGPSATVNRKRVLLSSSSSGGGGGGSEATGEDAGMSGYADASIMGADLYDPLGLGQRWAATASTTATDYVARTASTWTPSAEGWVMALKYASSDAPSAEQQLLGDSAAGEVNIRLNPNGTVVVRVSTTAVQQSAAGVIAFDGTPYSIEATLTNTTCTLLVNGTDVGTIDSHSETVTGAQASIEVGTLGVDLTTIPGAYWDIEYRDSGDTDNQLLFRMDETDGPFYNAYLKLDDPDYNASNTTGITHLDREGGCTGSTLVLSTDNAARGLVESDFEVARPTWAAYGGGYAQLASSTNWASLSWAPTTDDHELSARVGSSIAPNNNAVIVGEALAGESNIVINVDGTLRARAAGVDLITTSAGAFPYDGREHEVRAVFGTTEGAVYLDGVLLAEATYSDPTWVHTPSARDIGGTGATSRWVGTIRNAKFIDTADANNTALYRMNERTGDFLNAYANTADPLYDASNTVGNATRNGTVESRLVSTTDGLAPLAQSDVRFADANSVFAGRAAGEAVTTGVDNTFVGALCGDGTTIGDDNTAVGSGALSGVAGDDNTAVGYYALVSTTGAGNTAFGRSAAQGLTAASGVTAVGYRALFTGTTGIANCTAVGYQALQLATGDYNTAVGRLAGDAIVAGISNTAIGYAALSAAASSANTAVGSTALTATTGTDNTAVGVAALEGLVAGSGNTAVGRSALNAAISTSNNTAVGYAALNLATGDYNTAVGRAAGDAITTGVNCTAVGYNALSADSANGSTAVGSNALVVSTGGTCTAVGSSALSSSVTAANNTAVGHHALKLATGDFNTAVGKFAGDAITSGTSNTAVGWGSLSAATTTNANTAVGFEALLNATGDYNTAVGRAAGDAITSGSSNTAVGYNSLGANSTGGANVCIGVNAGRDQTVSNGTFVGKDAGLTSTGTTVTCVGYDAGSAHTTGAQCVYLGSYTGSDFPTTSNAVYISDGAGTVVFHYNGTNWFLGKGASALPTGDPAVSGALWNDSGTVKVSA